MVKLTPDCFPVSLVISLKVVMKDVSRSVGIPPLTPSEFHPNAPWSVFFYSSSLAQREIEVHLTWITLGFLGFKL